MKCAYCGKEGKASKEHIISCAILDMFPECYLTIDEARGRIHEADPMVKDVCTECNNSRINYIDSYAKQFISEYFFNSYDADAEVKVNYDYVMLQKMLLKYAFNDMRSRKEDTSYFDEELLSYLLNKEDCDCKPYVSVYGGISVNVTPVPDAVFGNKKLQWCKDPLFFENSIIRFIDYNTGRIYLNDECSVQHFQNAAFSYIFRFNSGQFILVCWNKECTNIETESLLIEVQYPYARFTANKDSVMLKKCTDEMNYFHINHIHVSWDLCNETGTMRMACTDKEQLKRLNEAWKKEEETLRKEHPRTK